MSERGDVIDRANDLAAQVTDDAVAEVRRAAASIPVGVEGDCDLCGEWSGRLVQGACARCRDLHRLP